MYLPTTATCVGSPASQSTHASSFKHNQDKSSQTQKHFNTDKTVTVILIVVIVGDSFKWMVIKLPIYSLLTWTDNSVTIF